MSDEPKQWSDAPNVFIYGDGKLWTQQGIIEGMKCVSIKRMEKPMPVGAQPLKWDEKYMSSDCDVLLVFRSLEGARVLQDEINGLVSEWAKKESPVVDHTK